MKYVDFKFVSAPAPRIEFDHDHSPGEPAGYHMAIEPLSGKVEWQLPMMDLRVGGHARRRRRAALQPAPDRRIIALDQATETLLEVQPVVGQPAPITYTHRRPA